MTNRLSSLWARAVGLKEWDREVTLLRNTLDNDTPAPGELPGNPTPMHLQEQTVTDEQRKDRYERWEGDEPGH
jgi:hypothetical protein